MISRKTEYEILKKLVEEYSKDFENSEREFEGLDSTDRIIDTLKGILGSAEQEFEPFSDIPSKKRYFQKTYQNQFQFWQVKSAVW